MPFCNRIVPAHPAREKPDLVAPQWDFKCSTLTSLPKSSAGNVAKDILFQYVNPTKALEKVQWNGWTADKSFRLAASSVSTAAQPSEKHNLQTSLPWEPWLAGQ